MANITGTNLGETIDGTVGNDTIKGLKGNDTLNGFDGNDRLFGNEGIDTLNGGVGNDIMLGGEDNDRYLVDSIGDRVFENLNGGLRDRVEASVSFVLGNNLEDLLLTGINAINGTGNALDNSIIGNDADNTISGGAGNDRLSGGLGNDTLNGGVGTNTLNGGFGDDTYNVSTRGGAINTIVDTGGIDTVQSTSTFTLGATIENLTLLGSGAINGTGNALNNVITGNGAANVLNGGIGDDTLNGGFGNDILNGGFGNDTYLVDNAGDIVTELVGIVPGGGTDTVQASINFTLAANVENLVLVGAATTGTGNTGDNIITGNDLANTLDGAAGDDTLVGRLGDDLLIGGLGNDTLFGGKDNDTLVGGFGADVYAFGSNAPFNSADLGVDVINGFNSGSDKIRLDPVTFGAITAANFERVANDEQAALSAGLITYSVATGNLFFNQDGATAGFGTGGQFATLNGIPAVAATDFS